jgi:uncharacterized protein (TIGR02453 family)
VAFEGFPAEALVFLADLGRNNDRAWFQEHRDEYDRLLLEPARDFVEAIGERLPEAQADPRVGRSIMRINRDTRFSKDKRPYKDHLDLWFWQGEGPSRGCPGYWFRLTPGRLILGAGMHSFERDMLERYREAAADERLGGALVEAVERLRAGGFEIGGRHYKRMPAGYDVPPERAELLLHSGLYTGIELEPPPPETATPEFPAFCAARWRTMAPLQDWLVELVA